MQWKWDKPLNENMRPNPVMYKEQVRLPAHMLLPTEQEMRQVFPSLNHSLKTWGRTPGVKSMDPHWIGIHKQTPLHTDFAYPRYTHQIFIKVDPFSVRGMDLTETPVYRGTYYQMDTHSPHQVLAKTKTAQWYLAASIDNEYPLPHEETIQSLIQWALFAPFFPEDFTL